nr:uncharacterized protein LOC109173053 [Ipomoea batatas]
MDMKYIFCRFYGKIHITDSSKHYEYVRWDLNVSISTEKKFGAWVRAPNRRPSPVTGNKWVVSSEHSARVTTPGQGQNVDAGTSVIPGLVREDSQSTARKDAQTTIIPKAQHVAPDSTGMHPTSNGSGCTDVAMEQADSQVPADGLVIHDPKRKRADSHGPSWLRLSQLRKATICRFISKFISQTLQTPDLAFASRVSGYGKHTVGILWWNVGPKLMVRASWIE